MDRASAAPPEPAASYRHLRAPAVRLTDPPFPGAVAACVAAVLAALLAAGIALAAGGGPVRDVAPGLPSAGTLVGWGLPALRLGADLAAVATVGSLLVPAVLVPGRGGRVPRLATAGAAAWSVLAAGAWVLTAAESAGVPVTGLDGDALRRWGSTGQGSALVVVAVGAALVAAGSVRCRTPRAARILLGLALAVALPVAVSGHVAEATTDATTAESGLVVHVLAALLWTGGLTALVLHLRRDSTELAVAAPRFSVLALGSYVALAGSGVLALTATVPLATWTTSVAWHSAYAGVVAAKVAALLVLGVIGHRHRRRTLPRLALGRPGAFRRLALVELVVMGAAVGLAAALARTPAPPVPRSTGGRHGHAAVDPISLAGLLGSWRVNAVVVVVLLTLLAAYLAGVRRVVGSGATWPVRRSVAFTAGLALAFLTACSGAAVWAPVLLSVHVAQLFAAVLVVPALLLLGRPVTLAHGCAGSVPALVTRVADHPALGTAATCVVLLGVLRTPFLEVSLGSPWWHLATLAAGTAAGTALLVPVLDPPGGGLVADRERAGHLLVVASCAALLAVQLVTSDRLLAGAWFLELRLGWADPLADQRLAGLVAAGAAGALLAGAVGVAARRR